MKNGWAAREGYYPGVIAECLRLHMEYYAPRWGFGAAFETKLAREMGAFFERYDAGRDLFLMLFPADASGNAAATIALDGSDAEGEGAHLRWFVAGAEARGRGLGNLLLGRVMAFCRERGHHRVYLTTFRGLDPARRLYEKHGFRLTAEKDEDQWKGGVVEQHFLWEDR